VVPVKEYTVGEVARLSHVSVRTLHHYDDIGLHTPSGRSPAGYRLYPDTDLRRQHRLVRDRQARAQALLGAVRRRPASGGWPLPGRAGRGAASQTRRPARPPPVGFESEPVAPESWPGSARQQ